MFYSLCSCHSMSSPLGSTILVDVAMVSTFVPASTDTSSSYSPSHPPSQTNSVEYTSFFPLHVLSSCLAFVCITWQMDHALCVGYFDNCENHASFSISVYQHKCNIYHYCPPPPTTFLHLAFKQGTLRIHYCWLSHSTIIHFSLCLHISSPHHFVSVFAFLCNISTLPDGVSVSSSMPSHFLPSSLYLHVPYVFSPPFGMCQYSDFFSPTTYLLPSLVSSAQNFSCMWGQICLHFHFSSFNLSPLSLFQSISPLMSNSDSLMLRGSSYCFLPRFPFPFFFIHWNPFLSKDTSIMLMVQIQQLFSLAHFMNVISNITQWKRTEFNMIPITF